MMESKVYIDFGNHLGKDRIPREVASGCCIITGKTGADKYKEDVYIGEKFKFDEAINFLFMSIINTTNLRRY